MIILKKIISKLHSCISMTSFHRSWAGGGPLCKLQIFYIFISILPGGTSGSCLNMISPSDSRWRKCCPYHDSMPMCCPFAEVDLLENSSGWEALLHLSVINQLYRKLGVSTTFESCFGGNFAISLVTDANNKWDHPYLTAVPALQTLFVGNCEVNGNRWEATCQIRMRSSKFTPNKCVRIQGKLLKYIPRKTPH